MKIIRPWRSKPVRKALLIGIMYRSAPDPATHLPGTVVEVAKLRDLLIDGFGYLPEDIVVMTDSEGVSPRLLPTKANILRQIRALVVGAQDGDHFLFHFAGHSEQVECFSGSEDDNQDETIICLDEERIKDNKLRKMLVNQLPSGASLTAIFDACYSGTLLDLNHYSCNNVWVPWVNRGSRSPSVPSWTTRENAASFASSDGANAEELDKLSEEPAILPKPRPRPAKRVTRTSIDVSIQKFGPSRSFGSFGEILGPLDMDFQKSAPETSISLTSIVETNPSVPSSEPEKTAPRWHLDLSHRTLSPDSLYPRFCDGLCRERPTKDNEGAYPLVISISASKDAQINWEDNGSSMTSLLIEILKETPQPTYESLMTRLNHRIHASTVAMHKYFHEQKMQNPRPPRPPGKMKRTWRDSKDKEIISEMNNFQEPQLGSMKPLNMEDTFIL